MHMDSMYNNNIYIYLVYVSLGKDFESDYDKEIDS